MKFIYEKVLAQLDTIPELRFIDLDKGQLEGYELKPSVTFPAALISIQLPRCEDLGGKKQRCQALISIRLAFDISGDTANITPAIHRANSLAYFDIVESVFKKLQGFKDININAFSRQNVREERRPDKYKVVVIPFSSSFIDE